MMTRIILSLIMSKVIITSRARILLKVTEYYNTLVMSFSLTYALFA